MRAATWSLPRPMIASDAVAFVEAFSSGTAPGRARAASRPELLLDNWCQGRRKALWISKSDKLLQDAQRDWSALGQERLLVTPLSRFAQGRDIPLAEGIPSPPMRRCARKNGVPRIPRVTRSSTGYGRISRGDPLRRKSHAMANARRIEGRAGDTDASQQGRWGGPSSAAQAAECPLWSMSSATGATTSPQPSPMRSGLGSGGGEDFPFSPRAVIRTSHRGGWRRRDGGPCPRHANRSASIPPDRCPMTVSNTRFLEHVLTPEQRGHLRCLCRGLFAIIHNNPRRRDGGPPIIPRVRTAR